MEESSSLFQLFVATAMHKVFIFNPGSEETWHLPSVSSYTPPRLVQRMMTDLSPMMRILGNRDDLVYVPVKGRSLYMKCGVSAKDLLDGESLLSYDSLCNDYPSIEIDFWAPQPCALNTFARIVSKSFNEVKLPVLRPELKDLVHRRMAAQLMSYIGQRLDFPKYLMAQELRSLDELPRIVQLLGRQLIAKIPFSSSGRGVFPFSYPLKADDLTLLSNALKREGSLMIEKHLDIVQDYATEWKIEKGLCSFVGYSFFHTNTSGSYTGNLLMSQQEIRKCLCRGMSNFLHHDILTISQNFIQEYIAPYYEGVLGIDSLIYRDECGAVVAYPSVEINLRKTMGYFAVELYNRLIPKGCKASFVVTPGFVDNCDLKFDADGRLCRGTLNLGSNASDRSFSAYIQIVENDPFI